MTLHDLGHGLHYIRLPLPLPRLRWVNAYVIPGEGRSLTLIDCGVATDESFAALESGLEAMGRTVDDIDRLIVTHMHLDHMAMAGRVVAASGCEVIMHRAWRVGYAFYQDWAVLDRRMVTLAAEHGATSDDVQHMTDVQARPDWAPPIDPPDREVDDGEEIPVGGGRSLEVLHTPGHEPAHICLCDSRTGALFSGDHVLPRITPVVPYLDEAPDALGDYLGSLERVEQGGFGLTYPAHGSVLELGAARARQILLHHERRLGAVTQELRHGPATAWSLMESLFRPNLMAFEQRLALRETLAHVEYLRLRDQATRFSEDGVWWYRLPRRKRTSPAEE